MNSLIEWIKDKENWRLTGSIIVAIGIVIGLIGNALCKLIEKILCVIVDYLEKLVFWIMSYEMINSIMRIVFVFVLLVLIMYLFINGIMRSFKYLIISNDQLDKRIELITSRINPPFFIVLAALLGDLCIAISAQIIEKLSINIIFHLILIVFFGVSITLMGRIERYRKIVGYILWICGLFVTILIVLVNVMNYLNINGEEFNSMEIIDNIDVGLMLYLLVTIITILLIGLVPIINIYNNKNAK